MTKILVINQFASTPKYSTGAGERFYYFCPWFKKNGFDMEVVSASYNHLFLNTPEVHGLFKKESVPGGSFTWVRVRKYQNNSIGRIRSWLEFLIKLFFYPIGRDQRPDVVILSSMSIFPVFYCWYLKKRYGIPFILEIRDIWPLTLIHLGGYSRNNLFIRLFSCIEKFAYKKADEITSVLPGFDRYLRSLHIEKRCHWVPNGTIWAKDFTAFDLPFDVPENKFIVAYTGAMGVANALEHLIEAANLLRNHSDIIIMLLGDGPEKPKLKELSKDVHNLIFLPKVHKEQVRHFLQKVDVGFISWKDKEIYQYGVSANKYNDYMMASLPILSASSIPDDPVKMAECGFQANSEDPRDIADQIIKLYSMSEEDRASLGANGFQFVQTQTYDVLTIKYLQLIQDTLDKRDPNTPVLAKD